MREPIIHRLMRELEDGSFEVAGYQVWSRNVDAGHVILLQVTEVDLRNMAGNWGLHRLKFTRIDRYTGITLNDEAKTKVFERDKIEFQTYSKDSPVYSGVIIFKDGQYVIHDKPVMYTLHSIKHFKRQVKIVGVEGVNKTEESTQ